MYKYMESTDIDKRINRMIGQINGIRKMIHANRDPGAIAQQVIAAREALSRLGMLVLKEGIHAAAPESEKKITKLMKTVFRI